MRKSETCAKVDDFFEPVPEVYLQAWLVSVGAALLAAVYPMVRLSRLQVADALREE